jgi:hypothetical protein
LLVIIPFLPEIVIWITATLAEIMGCRPDQKDTCLIWSLPVSEIIAIALRISAGFVVAATNNGLLWFAVFCGAVTAWLVVCYCALTLGWARTRSRLLLGFAIAVAFAFLPYFGPLLSVAKLANSNCQPNEGGVGSCEIFGGYVGPAHDAVRAGWLILAGAPIALGAFIIYAAVMVMVSAVSRKRSETPVRQ